MQKLTLLSSPGRYEGSQSDCILLATNEDIQAINAGSPNVHINLHTVQKVDGGKGKMVGEQPCPIKYHYINVFLVPFFVDMERESCSKHIDIVGITLCTSDTK